MPTLISTVGQHEKKENLLGVVFHREEGFIEGQDLEGGFRVVEDLGTCANQSYRVAEDTRKGVEGRREAPIRACRE